MSLRKLYPPIAPYDTGFLDVGDGHTLYYEQAGNPAGRAAVFLHGGPGAGSDEKARRFFDPAAFRIVVFDQRGAGRSRPHASLHANTTPHLVADIEHLRTKLGIERWLVFGGSWGSTLALRYAESHPDAVSALILRGIFLLRRKELEWFYQEGASRVYPDRWQRFLAPIPAHERHDLLTAYHRRLNADDADSQREVARAWSIWEGSTSTLQPSQSLIDRFAADEFALALARIETHYFVNGGFLASENEILDGLDRIRRIPCVIVQGRYDLVCPMDSAWELHRAWPEARFEIVADAGHSALEPGITDRLIAATDQFAIQGTELDES